MSEPLPPDDRPDEAPQRGPDDMGEMPVEETRRAASITLRPAEVRQRRAASMEAANQSLSDALRITSRLIQVVMVVLVALFIASGVVRVEESERGVKVLLGEVTNEEVSPGLTLGAPPPIGDVIRVNTGQRNVILDDSFFFQRTEDEKRRPASELPAGGGSLRPGNDGSLITADGGLVHAQLDVQYSISSAGNFVRNVIPDQLEEMVRVSLEAATVKVISQVTIDELIAPLQSGDRRSRADLERRIRRLAQDRLDALQTGVALGTVSMEVIPPRQVKQQFAEVNTAAAQASERRQRAESLRAQILNATAGTAYRPLLALIDTYDEALVEGDEQEAERILDEIIAVLAGERNGVDVEIMGERYSQVEVAGAVATLMSDATRYRNTVAAGARSRYESFRAKLEQFRASPTLFVRSEWAEAMNDFMQGGTATSSFYPADTEIVRITINRDPDIDREVERARAERQLQNNTRLDRLRSR